MKFNVFCLTTSVEKSILFDSIYSTVMFFESNIGFILSFSLVMIPLILSVDTLQNEGDYVDVHHKTRVNMLKISLKVVRDVVSIFLITILLDINNNIIWQYACRSIELVIIIVLCSKLLDLFRYLLDEISRFENFK